ncbi:hypothetical protein Rhe02_56890 [Rhizocola hellebori]|uniref:Uncharacterized protein n=1 Tax=Rhizocola hellebori TaxID=1392758 RepID=A0A8J3QCP9_9ACTN|nr:hypothetical protein Rhe02_56890 [Rhizocola hellebori]
MTPSQAEDDGHSDHAQPNDGEVPHGLAFYEVPPAPQIAALDVQARTLRNQMLSALKVYCYLSDI